MALRLPVTVLIGLMCIAQVLLVMNLSIFATLLPDYRELWQLNNTEAGWISAMLFAGYTVAVPFLVSLTDRKDPKKIYLLSAGFSAVASFGFALFAQGLWSALFFHAMIGVGLAGTYMPGLKALSDHVEDRHLSRATAFYTSSFGVGTGLSYIFTGIIAEAISPSAAFFGAGIAGIAALLIVWLVLPAGHDNPDASQRWSWDDLRQVVRNRTSMAYTLCYMFHNWELFGLRTWVVAFLIFTQNNTAGEGVWIAPIALATVFTFFSMPSSIMGNELAIRFGRRKMTFIFMSVSALVCLVIGFTSAISYGLASAVILLHGFTVASESSTVTAGAIGNSVKGLRGATMAVHSTIGFIGSIMGPLMFGLMLDLGGGESTLGFVLAFGHMGLIMLLGPLVLRVMKPEGLREDRVS